MKKYQWLIHTPNGGTREVGSFAKAVGQLSGRPCFASLTHRRFLRRSNNVIYYPDGYRIERICLTQRAADAPKRAPICTCSMDDGIHEWNCALNTAHR